MATGIVIAVNPLAQIQKAQDAKRKSDLSQIQKALETYYQDVGKYPSSTSGFKIIRLDGSTADWGTQWQPYMSTIPKDPSSSKSYVYRNSGLGGETYYIFASLDRGVNDPQICQPNGSKCNNDSSNSGCGTGAICNYGVSSPNVTP